MQAKSKGSKRNVWILLLFLLAGIVLGGFVGELCHMLGTAVPALGFLKWLSFGKSFGFPSPFVVDLEIIKLSFMMTVKLTVCGILGMIVSFFLFRRL